MASSGIFFLLFIVILAVAAFVDAKCKNKNVGLLGRHTLLECVIEVTQEVEDPEILIIVWKKEGSEDPLVFFNRGELMQEPGYSFAERAWNNKNMNVSLLITNTATTDDGDYTCEVITDSGESKTQMSLGVKAKYSVPTIRSDPEKIVPNEDSTLICQAEGGFPKAELRWFDIHGEDWTASSELEVKEMAGGLFQLRSKLSLLKGSTYSKYSCVLFNASGLREEETTFEMPPTFYELGEDQKKSEASKIVAPVLVIGSLIVGLLLVLLYKRRSHQHRHGELPTQDMGIDEGDQGKMEKEGQDIV